MYEIVIGLESEVKMSLIKQKQSNVFRKKIYYIHHITSPADDFQKKDKEKIFKMSMEICGDLKGIKRS